MGKELLIIRHAKSDWSGDVGKDFDRPLAKRGVEASKQLGQALTTMRAVPELIITSPAKRALETTKLLIKHGGWDCEVEREREFYGGGPDHVLDTVQGIDKEFERVAIIGHEPTWSAFASAMIGGAEIHVPTACLIRVELKKTSWRKISYGDGCLMGMYTARALTALAAKR